MSRVVSFRANAVCTIRCSVRDGQAAGSSLTDRAALLANVYDNLEQGLEYMGVTAVEDRLQTGVPAAMRRLREAGMHIWVLTGDRMETAINVSLAAGHFTPRAVQLFACGLADEAACRAALSDHLTAARTDAATMRRVRGSQYGTMGSSGSQRVWRDDSVLTAGGGDVADRGRRVDVRRGHGRRHRGGGAAEHARPAARGVLPVPGRAVLSAVAHAEGAYRAPHQEPEARGGMSVRGVKCVK